MSEKDRQQVYWVYEPFGIANISRALSEEDDRHFRKALEGVSESAGEDVYVVDHPAVDLTQGAEAASENPQSS